MYTKDIHGLLVCVKIIISVGTFFLNHVIMMNGFHYPRFFNISFKCPPSYIIDFLAIALKLKKKNISFTAIPIKTSEEMFLL